jgi:hypothetical protein
MHTVRVLFDVVPVVSGGSPDKFVGPAGLLQAYRFIADTRDEAINERLDNLEDTLSPVSLLIHHESVWTCVRKDSNPTRAIGKIKDLLVTAPPYKCMTAAETGQNPLALPPRSCSELDLIPGRVSTPPSGRPRPRTTRGDSRSCSLFPDNDLLDAIIGQDAES